ncbi:MAG TPA: carboxypeptidase-like regulatory domain-containing protein [Alloacidobacterium sp.]|nr:carboxypeptidase-like regulatory domain-containing protein [Alloacidobacterium sp.]
MRAQSGGSSIQGTISDASGAVVQNAGIALTNIATGVVLKTQSDPSGSYSFPSVQPGIYSIDVLKDGFASYKISQFNVVVGQHVTQNATLNVASSSSSVIVDASGLSNLLDSQSNDLGTVIGPQSVKQLPLNGRNYLQLGLLSGATQPTSGAANGSVAQTGHPGMSINIAGNQPDYTMYVVNGLQTLGSRAGNTSLNLSVGAIDQFEVHYGFFMPDMGPNPGIVDVVTKSGTNRIHGEVYEFVRNNQMEARNYFSINPNTGLPIAPGPYHQNQFGFDVGGPILKDKLFYFVNYEGYRQTQSAIVNAYAPTAAMFTGDFSQAGVNIYDPATYNPATNMRTQFPGNKIPDSRISPAAKALLAYYTPGSSLADKPNNVSGTPKTTLNSDQFMGRIDYSINTQNQIFAQGNWLNAPTNNPGLFPGQGTSYPLDTELVNLGWNWTLSSSKVNELRLGMIRDSVYDEGLPVNGLQQRLNITGTADPNGVPSIGMTGFSGFGTSTGLIGNLDNVYQINDGFNWLHGNHQIKFGAEIAYLRTIQSSANANARGVFNFNGNFTAQFPASGGFTPIAGTGSSFADFLLGYLTSGQSIGMPRTHLRWTTAQPYIQDNWKIRPDLTANIALSWYAATSPNPSGPDKNLVHGFDFTLGKPIFAALGQMNPAVYPMTLTNWAPRVGINYSPAALKNTVIRAGWGLYYTTQEAVNFQYAVVSQVITINNAVSNVQPTPTYVLGQNAMPSVTVGQITQPEADAITGPIQYLSQTNRSPYVSQWNFDVQHTFASKYLLDIGYIGSESHHLALNWNPFDCSAPGSNICNDANNPYNGKYSYMQEVDSIGYGNYNALLIKFQRQFSRGLSILANYTWSKALAASQEGSNGTLNQRKSCLLACDYGPTTSNIPQSLVISAVWELPVGRGRYFGRQMNPVLNTVVGGWDVDAIGTMQKGTPFTLTAPNNTAWSPAQIRANTYCNGREALSNKSVRSNGHYWMKGQTVGQTEANGACYVDPSIDPVNLVNGKLPGRAAFGTSSFDSMTGPGLNNWDIGVHKTIPIYREMSFTLRGEFFNAWNHAQFANPNSGVGSNTFGQIGSTQHDAREIQIGGTLQF